MRKNFLVIGGGVGPAASVMFHKKIVDKTQNKNLGDQGHLPLIHLSMSPYILDRTKFLMREIDTNPGINMGLAVKEACKSYDGIARNFIVGVPCNTFHSSRVFDAYRSIIDHPRIKVVHMIKETMQHIKDKHGGKKVILLSTTGTRNKGVYQPPQGSEIDLITCTDKQQDIVMGAIYNKAYAIKSANPNYSVALADFENVIKDIIEIAEANEYQNAESERRDVVRYDFCVIMGCTEIPLAYNEARGKELQLGEMSNYIDPMDLLARRMVELAENEVDVSEDQVPSFNKENAERFTRDLFPLSKL